MPVGDILETRIICTAASQTSVNVLHYRIGVSTTPEPTNAEAAVAIDVLLQGVMKSLLSAQATYRGIGVRRVFPLPPTPEGSTIASLGPGVVPGDQVPRQVTGLITKRTAFAGRKFRGRIYVPFPGEDDTTASGSPSAAYVTNLISLNSLLIVPVPVTGGAGGSWTLTAVLFHRATNTFDPLLPGTPRGNFATQRRRGDLGRPNPPPF